MSVSRRGFLSSAAIAALTASILSPGELEALQQAKEEAADDEALPHSSYDFWTGFYGPVMPGAATAGGTRGRDSLQDTELETQYLHYKDSEKKLVYAHSIDKSELLDHDGDVAVSLLLNQYRPASVDVTKDPGAQIRVDATQTRPIMNLLAPLAWTAMASISPDKAGKIPGLDQLGFKSAQVTSSSSHILLTQGCGKLAVNISKAPKSSVFLKALNVMITGAKLVAPMVTFPAVSIPAMSAFSEAFSYWEDRTRFILNGNLMNTYATQAAADDPEMRDPSIKLVSGDYVVVAQKDTAKLEAVMANLMIYQGYLVPKDAKIDSLSLESLKQSSAVPDITYATIKVGVTAMDSHLAKPPAGAAHEEDAAGAAKSGPSKSGSAKGEPPKGGGSKKNGK